MRKTAETSTEEERERESYITLAQLQQLFSARLYLGQMVCAFTAGRGRSSVAVEERMLRRRHDEKHHSTDFCHYSSPKASSPLTSLSLVISVRSVPVLSSIHTDSDFISGGHKVAVLLVIGGVPDAIGGLRNENLITNELYYQFKSIYPDKESAFLLLKSILQGKAAEVMHNESYKWRFGNGWNERSMNKSNTFRMLTIFDMVFHALHKA